MYWCPSPAREKGNHKGICLHYITRRGAPSELINFPDFITCILKAHRNLECNDFVLNGSSVIISGATVVQQHNIAAKFGCTPKRSHDNTGFQGALKGTELR